KIFKLDWKNLSDNSVEIGNLGKNDNTNEHARTPQGFPATFVGKITPNLSITS
ncbi:uncharacterized protein FOMMEDRAFT_169745, partial [Fomitiporia mediterranea MF3/22]|uniref:uncharacterized protein n=1 Tax=Fomitiporia mediterranea (strain MF3/22) TaxID=694068 RepID=UPI00044098DF